MSPKDQQMVLVSSTSGAEEIMEILSASDFPPTLLAEPSTAVAMVRAVKPEMVLLLSSGKGEFTSLALLARIHKQFPAIPILVIATSYDDETVVDHLAGGASDFIYFVGSQKSLLGFVVHRSLQFRMPDPNTAEELETTLRLLEKDQQSGFRVQQAMMPNSPTNIGGLVFNHQLYPSMIMSGDFIDYFEQPDGRAAFYIADVSGHGASSAFITVLLKSFSRRLIDGSIQLGSTAEILAWMNRELLQWELEQHVTMFLGIIDAKNNTLEYSNAAHFPGTILCHGEGASFLEIGGQPLGLYSEPEYETHTINLPDIYSIVMFSDGVFEIMPQTSVAAKEVELLSLVKSHRDNDLDMLVDQLGVLTADNIPDDIAVFKVAST